MKKIIFFSLCILLFVGCREDEPLLPPSDNSGKSLPMNVSLTPSTTTTIQYGSSIKVSWNVTNADTVRVNGKSVSLQGSVDVIKDTIITLTAKKGTEVVTKAVSILTTTAPLQPTITVTGNTNIVYADNTTISWATTNATTVKVNDSIIATSGSLTLNQLVANKTLVFTVTNAANGTTTKTITVNVGDWKTSTLGLLTQGYWQLSSLKYYDLNDDLSSSDVLTPEQTYRLFQYKLNGMESVTYDRTSWYTGGHWSVSGNIITEGSSGRTIYKLDENTLVLRETTTNIYEITYTRILSY